MTLARPHYRLRCQQPSAVGSGWDLPLVWRLDETPYPLHTQWSPTSWEAIRFSKATRSQFDRFNNTLIHPFGYARTP